MKRYHRSKKRSQIRIKNDHEEKADGIIGGKLTESSTETKQKLKETKLNMLSSGSIRKLSTFPQSSGEHKEIRIENKKVIASDSTNDATNDSTKNLNTDTNSHCEENQSKIKMEIMAKSTTKTADEQTYIQKKIDIHTKTSKTWVENIDTTDKKISNEHSKLEQAFHTNNQTTDGTLLIADNLKPPKEITQESEDHLTMISVKDKKDPDMPENNKCTMNIKRTTTTSKPLDTNVKELQGRNIEPICSQQTEKIALNEVVKYAFDDTMKGKKSVNILSKQELDCNTHEDCTKQQLTLRMEQLSLLDNVWLDQYKYNDAEKQYYQQAGLQQCQKTDIFEKAYTPKPQESKETIVVEKDDDDRDVAFEKKTIAVEMSIKPKQRFTYEIIEEIIERTEITYQLVNKETEDVYMKEHLNKFENQNLEFEQYLSELGGYVKTLEDRVKILEKGGNKLFSERSSSLSSNASDEGVDMTGGSSDLISKLRKMGPRNGKCESNMKDIPISIRNKKGSLGL